MSSSIETRQQRRARERAEVKKNRRRRRLGLLAGAGMLLAAGSMSAATITVNSLADSAVAGDGFCTLREALANANGDAQTTGGDCVAGLGADTIQFQAGLTGTLTLTGGQLTITDATSILGPGANAITISGNDSSRVFFVQASGATPINVDIHDLTLTHGAAASGGALYAGKTNLSLANVVITGNTATNDGGGIAFDGAAGGTLTVTNSRVSANTATSSNGGGLAVKNGAGAVQLQNDTFDGNQAGQSGGGISLLMHGGGATIANCVVSGNTAGTMLNFGGYGGGIQLFSDVDDGITISQSVISGNVADPNDAAATPLPGSTASDIGFGGGVAAYTTVLTISQTTITGNTAADGGGIETAFEPNTFSDLTVANNVAASPVSDGVGGGMSFIGSESTIGESTITGNSAEAGGGGIETTSVHMHDTIVANNTSSSGTTPDIDGTSVIAIHSLVKTPGTTTIGGTGNLAGVDPNLGTLANNGSTIVAGAPGTTQTPQTELPLCGSPAIDAGDPAFVPPPSTDERGLTRVVNGTIDIGSVEVNPGTLQFSTTAQSVSEGGGNATVTVTRSGGFDNAVSVNYATANGTAVAPGDYTATSGTLNWTNGDTANKSFTVPIVDDAVFEGNETFTASLSAPACGAAIGANASQTITIIDNETQPAITIADSSGSESITPRPFTVTLSGASSQTITVDYATADGTAVAGSDYTTTAGTLTFAPLETVKTINVPIINDTLDEPDETFFVNLTNATNSTIARTQARGTIQDDDGPPALSINSPSQAEGNSGSTNMTFTVTLSAASGQTVSVNYATANGTATAGSDYTSTSGVLTFSPGTTSQTIQVPIVGDTTCEPDETFTVSLSSPANATIASGVGTGTITNDDSCNADLSISKALTTPGPYVQGQNAVYTITVTNGGPSTATNTVVSDTLPPGAQFVSAVPSQGTCSGTTTVTCSLGTLSNAASATVTLTAKFTAWGTVSNTATVTSPDDANTANNAATANATVSPSSAIPALGGRALALLAAVLAFFGIALTKKS